jgi:hypothetical protein
MISNLAGSIDWRKFVRGRGRGSRDIVSTLKFINRVEKFEGRGCITWC